MERERVKLAIVIVVLPTNVAVGRSMRRDGM
jgi:hypothetical protein